MKVFISMLRGVNMTGHNSVKMTDLADLYKSLGYKDAETYIQSGNVIFNCGSDLTIADVTSKIEKAIFETFIYKVPVMIRTIDEMRNLKLSNPYHKEADIDPSKIAVILLHEEITDAQIQKVINIDFPPDKFNIIGREIFIYCPNGFGKTKIYTNFFEKKMGVTGTARNWKTINKLLEIAEKKQ